MKYNSSHHELFKSHLHVSHEWLMGQVTPMNDPRKRWLKCLPWITHGKCELLKLHLCGPVIWTRWTTVYTRIIYTVIKGCISIGNLYYTDPMSQPPLQRWISLSCIGCLQTRIGLQGKVWGWLHLHHKSFLLACKCMALVPRPNPLYLDLIDETSPNHMTFRAIIVVQWIP